MHSELTTHGLIGSLLNPNVAWKSCRFEVPGSCIIECFEEGCLEISPINNASLRALVYSAGVHGNETAPIELLDKLLGEILSGALIPKQAMLLLIGNPQAMRSGKRELATNLNRLFCEAHKNSKCDFEHVRAAELEHRVSEFFSKTPANCQRVHLDLHTAIRDSQFEKFVVYPFTHGKGLDPSALGWLQACQIDCVLISNTPTTTFSYHSATVHQARAFTIELGKVRAFGHNDLQAMHAMYTQLGALLNSAPEPDYPIDLERSHWFAVSDTLLKNFPDFEFSFDDDLANFTQFNEGEIIAKQNGAVVAISDGPKAVIFPNAKVAIGQRSALLVKELSEDEKSNIVDGK